MSSSLKRVLHSCHRTILEVSHGSMSLAPGQRIDKTFTPTWPGWVHVTNGTSSIGAGAGARSLAFLFAPRRGMYRNSLLIFDNGMGTNGISPDGIGGQTLPISCTDQGGYTGLGANTTLMATFPTFGSNAAGDINSFSSWAPAEAVASIQDPDSSVVRAAGIRLTISGFSGTLVVYDVPPDALANPATFAYVAAAGSVPANQPIGTAYAPYNTKGFLTNLVRLPPIRRISFTEELVVIITPTKISTANVRFAGQEASPYYYSDNLSTFGFLTFWLEDCHWSTMTSPRMRVEWFVTHQGVISGAYGTGVGHPPNSGSQPHTEPVGGTVVNEQGRPYKGKTTHLPPGKERDGDSRK